MEKEFKFDWSEFGANDYAEFCAKAENGDFDEEYKNICPFEFIASIRCGELSFDLEVCRDEMPCGKAVATELRILLYALGYDVTGMETGWANGSIFDEPVPYCRLGDGYYMKYMPVEYTYENFQKVMEDKFIRMLNGTEFQKWYKDDLKEVAKRPLIKW